MQVGSITVNVSINFTAAVLLDLWVLLASEFHLDLSRHTCIFLCNMANIKLLSINYVEMLEE